MRSLPLLAALAPFLLAGCGLATAGTGSEAAPGTIGGAPGSGSTGEGGSAAAGAGAGPSVGIGGSSAPGIGGGSGSGVGASAGKGGVGGGTGKGGSGAAPAGGTSAASGSGGASVGQGGAPVGQGGATVGQGGAPVGQGGAPVGQGGGAAQAGSGGGGQSGASGATAGSSPGGTGGSGPCETPPGPCVGSLAPGWVPSVYEPNHASACPTGYAQHDAVIDPVAGAAACGCSCAPAASCTSGMVDTYLGDSGCGTKGLALDVNGTGCTSLGFVGTLAAHFSAVPAPAVVTCTTAETTDPKSVVTAAVRVCEPPPACVEDVCNGAAPPGFSVCLVHDGDVACPGGWPNRTLAGSTSTLSCSACLDCTATADCTGAKVTFYQDDMCSPQGANTFDVDSKCHGASGDPVAAFKYSANATNVKCAASGPKTATVVLSAPRTICCKLVPPPRGRGISPPRRGIRSRPCPRAIRESRADRVREGKAPGTRLRGAWRVVCSRRGKLPRFGGHRRAVGDTAHECDHSR